MEALGHGAIRFQHRGDRRKHVAFPGRLVLIRARFCLELFGARFHRGAFLGRESLARRCALGRFRPGLLGCALTFVHENFLSVA
jgi:hypothetical protein